jgi:hypothetical protein
MLASGTEGGDGCGWWQALVADRFSDRLRPFCLADGCDVPSTFFVGAEYLIAMVRPGVALPGSDRGRPVSWLTDPSRRVSTRHPK